jgi:hypothetical protein
MKLEHVVVLALGACALKGDREAPREAEQVSAVAKTEAVPAAPAAVAQDRPADENGVELDGASSGGGKDRGQAKGGAPRAETATRAWFPETFLFEPLVVTDRDGRAEVPVRVPDRLTTWRVLALAHSRAGAQAGAVTSFVGTLPTYVDPVVPPVLAQGDAVRLPIQLVNTTHAPVRAALEVSATGATLARAGGARTVPADGSTVEYARLTADRAGAVQLRAALAGSDAVERAIAVRPTGRPITASRSGTLAAPRSFATPGTPGADPATDRATLRVFPGALAVLRSELAVSTARAGAADDAYALLLAGKAAALLAALGDTPDAPALRELAIVTGQRVLRAARTLDVAGAALVVEPASAHPDNPVLARLAERAAAYLAQHQRPDGTFAGQTGWTLQRLLVVTADATRAATALQATPVQRQRAVQVAIRAGAAFERTADQVTDGYTAAALLASGPLPARLADRLRARVREAIRPGEDGARVLAVAPGVVRGDGAVPSAVEATALAVLALDGDPRARAERADLGATVLGAYSITHGWGDGRANLVAVRAVLALFQAPLPASVAIRLEMDGREVAHGTLAGAKLRDVAVLEAAAPGLAGPHQWTVVAEPAVPGLGYALALDSWVPWTAERAAGVELAVPARVAAKVGAPVALAISAVAPSALPLHVQHALPAGVQVDTASLQALVAAGAITRFVASDGAVDLWAAGLAPGQRFAVSYRAVATLGGTLHTGASLVEAGPARVHVPPATWTVE